MVSALAISCHRICYIYLFLYFSGNFISRNILVAIPIHKANLRRWTRPAIKFITWKLPKDSHEQNTTNTPLHELKNCTKFPVKVCKQLMDEAECDMKNEGFSHFWKSIDLLQVSLTFYSRVMTKFPNDRFPKSCRSRW